MKNSTISTISTAKQLSKKINQLKNLIKKFPSVRSLIRRWGFELVILEGRLEALKAVVAVVETPQQLTIWDVVMESGTKENPIKIYFNPQDELVSLFPREGASLASVIRFHWDWIDEQGIEYDSRDESLGVENKWVELDDGIHFIDEDGAPLNVGWEIRNGEPVKIKR